MLAKLGFKSKLQNEKLKMSPKQHLPRRKVSHREILIEAMNDLLNKKGKSFDNNMELMDNYKIVANVFNIPSSHYTNTSTPERAPEAAEKLEQNSREMSKISVKDICSPLYTVYPVLLINTSKLRKPN